MNSKRGEIHFEVGGVSYSTRLSTNAMVKYQDETGENVLDAFAALEGRPDMRRFRDIFWAALTGDYSKDEVGDLMDDLGMAEVGRIIGDTAKAAFPDAEKGDAEGNGKAGKDKARQTKTQ